VLDSKLGIERPDAQTLHAPQFGDAPGVDVHVWKAHPKHTAGDLGAALLVGPGGGVEAGHFVGVIGR